ELRATETESGPAETRAPGRQAAEIEAAAADNGLSCSTAAGGLTRRDLETVVDGVRYGFSASVFFQANSRMLSPLIDEVTAGESGSLALDLYAGVGLFTIPLAKRFERVIAVESDDRAASYARGNAKANGVEGVKVIGSKVEAARHKLREF